MTHRIDGEEQGEGDGHFQPDGSWPARRVRDDDRARSTELMAETSGGDAAPAVADYGKRQAIDFFAANCARLIDIESEQQIAQSAVGSILRIQMGRRLTAFSERADEVF